MYLYELFTPVQEPLLEAVIRVEDGQKHVFVTRQFLADFEHFRYYSDRDIPAIFNEFLKAKLANPRQPFNGKDTRFAEKIPAMHCHLAFGKVIVIYNTGPNHVEVYRMVEHRATDTKQAVSNLATWVEGLAPSDFQEWSLDNGQEENVEFAPALFDDIQGLVYGMVGTPEDRQLLAQYLSTGSGDFLEYLVGSVMSDHEQMSPEIVMREFYAAWEQRYKMSFSDYIARAMG